MMWHPIGKNNMHLITSLLMAFIVIVDYVFINFIYTYTNYIHDCFFLPIIRHQNIR